MRPLKYRDPVMLRLQVDDKVYVTWFPDKWHKDIWVHDNLEAIIAAAP